MDRRKFIKGYLPAGMMVPSIGNHLGFRVFEQGHAFLNTLLLPAEDNDRVLVVIQLNGGNDGLNTVIPLDRFSQYVNARKNLYITENKVLRLNGASAVGLHPSMTGMQQMYNNGELHIIQSVGYPQPNFSHFRATDIWMSASDSGQMLNTGWLGRYLDEWYPGFPAGYPSAAMPDPLAIQIGSITSMALQGPAQPMGMSITNPSSFYSFVNNQVDPAPDSYAGKELTFIREMSKQTQQYGTVIKNANAKVTAQSTYPSGNTLADQLKIVARLIKGGLKSKIYMVNYGGFDTHANQVVSTDTATGTHARLLANVSSAIKAFQDDLRFLGVHERVIGMTFSEFGRRILSNASSGTDHGAAAPMFVFGTQVRPGITGNTPLIPSNATVNDNIPYQYDFRSIYASLLSSWLCVDSNTLNKVMLKNFQQLPITLPGACKVSDPVGNSLQLLTVYPNPFQHQINIQFKTNGGHTLLQVMDGAGRLIRILVDREFAAGTYRMDYNGEHLPAGIYYIRLQNLDLQQVRSALKVR